MSVCMNANISPTLTPSCILSVFQLFCIMYLFTYLFRIQFLVFLDSSFPWFQYGMNLSGYNWGAMPPAEGMAEGVQQQGMN